MNYLILMHIIQCLQCLLDNRLCQWLTQFSFLLQKIIQLSRIAQFQYKINKLMITKKRIQFDNIWMIQERLNLYLSNQLN